MTSLQTLELRASEIRARLTEIGGLDGDMGDETRSELTKLRGEYGDNERRQQALRIGNDTPTPTERRNDSEGMELRSVIGRANVGEMFDNIMGRGVYTGANEELRSHYGLESNQVPLVLLREHDRGWENRAVTPAPTSVQGNQQPIVDYVFPQSVGAFLGIDMPTVPVGDAVFPVLTSELTVGTPAENAAQAETTGAFSADALSPSRIQASFFYSREDRARFAGMDAALRDNLSRGLADGLDKQVIVGTNGLLTGDNLAANAAAAATSFYLYISDFAYGRVDGRYATSAADLRIVMGSGAYVHAGGVYRNASVDRTALDRLMELTAGVRVSAHVPAVASAKQNAIIRRGMARDMVAPIWEGITLIPDEITKAGTGQIVITAVMLHAVKILRKAGFHKQQIQNA